MVLSEGMANASHLAKVILSAFALIIDMEHLHLIISMYSGLLGLFHITETYELTKLSDLKADRFCVKICELLFIRDF